MQTCFRDLTIQLPRLACLVRRARRMNDSSQARNKAAVLTRSLWESSSLDEWISERFATGAISITPTVNPVLGSELDYSLSYRHVTTFFLTTLYWSLRNVLCGLALALLENQPPMPCAKLLDYTALTVSDVACARYLAMSVQYAAEARSVLPLYSELIVTPLLLSFGAWHRLQSRSARSTSTDARSTTARSMMEWIVSVADLIGTRFGFGGVDREAILRKHECLMGGDLASLRAGG